MWQFSTTFIIVSVLCSYFQIYVHANDGDLRLGYIQLTNTTITGYVEVKYNGSWGTICDDFWDINDARVACTDLGYGAAIKAIVNAAAGSGAHEIFLSGISCVGNESKLVDCTRSKDWNEDNDCNHSEDSGVECLLDLNQFQINESVEFSCSSQYLAKHLRYPPADCRLVTVVHNGYQFCDASNTTLCPREWTSEELLCADVVTEVYETHWHCCSGYANVKGVCKPICEHSCTHNSTCVAPNMCNCSSDFTGIDCSIELGDCVCVNGYCTNSNTTCECDSGYTGKICSEQCQNNTYGKGCFQTCSCNLAGTDSCNASSGECNCHGAWYGALCDNYCGNNSCSHQISSSCKCQNNGTCLNGACNCTEGWFGPVCALPCVHNMYGKNCEFTCKQNCINGMCNKISGMCDCDDGYNGDYCQKMCSNFSYGSNCDKYCSCNFENSLGCDPFTGKCICSKMAYGEFCEHLNCPIGTFGKDCEENCSCSNNSEVFNPLPEICYNSCSNDNYECNRNCCIAACKTHEVQTLNDSCSRSEFQTLYLSHFRYIAVVCNPGKTCLDSFCNFQFIDTFYLMKFEVTNCPNFAISIEIFSTIFNRLVFEELLVINSSAQYATQLKDRNVSFDFTFRHQNSSLMLTLRLTTCLTKLCTTSYIVLFKKESNIQKCENYIPEILCQGIIEDFTKDRMNVMLYNESYPCDYSKKIYCEPSQSFQNYVLNASESSISVMECLSTIYAIATQNFSCDAQISKLCSQHEVVSDTQIAIADNINAATNIIWRKCKSMIQSNNTIHFLVNESYIDEDVKKFFYSWNQTKEFEAIRENAWHHCLTELNNSLLDFNSNSSSTSYHKIQEIVKQFQKQCKFDDPMQNCATHLKTILKYLKLEYNSSMNFSNAIIESIEKQSTSCEPQLQTAGSSLLLLVILELLIIKVLIIALLALHWKYKVLQREKENADSLKSPFYSAGITNNIVDKPIIPPIKTSNASSKPKKFLNGVLNNEKLLLPNATELDIKDLKPNGKLPPLRMSSAKKEKKRVRISNVVQPMTTSSPENVHEQSVHR